MRKKWKGYFSVEASLILPVVLFLYLIIILAALFLYCRAAISQDNFLLAMRAERFTWGEEEYGEVIYGLEEMGNWRPKDYVEERLNRKKVYYPFFPVENGICRLESTCVLVETRQKGLKSLISKKMKKTNPVNDIRKWRGSQNV